MGTADTVPNPQAMGEWFMRRASVSADRPAITFQGTTWSFSDLRDRVVATANALHREGVRKGDRVGILTINRPDILVILFAAARLGAIVVPVNFRLTAPELRYVVCDAEIHTLIVGPEHVDIIQTIVPELPCKNYVQFGRAEISWPNFDDWIGERGQSAPAVSIDDSDVCAILYTSGTTGSPKGAMITHSNVWTNNLNWVLAFGITDQDVMLSVAPMFHAGGLFAAVLASLMLGGHVVLQSQFISDDFLNAIRDRRVTLSFGVPTMILALTQSAGFEAMDFSALRYFIVGGAPSPESLLRICTRRSIPVSHAYGMTEATSVATILETSLALDKVGSVGRAVMLGDMRLVDGNGAVVTAPHQKAEVHVRGGHIFAGYWRKPEATSAAFVDGWFASGDVGYLDEDGYLYICDRLKDMIISGGENIYPAEIESILLEHPNVVNAAVVGAPDEKWGETVVAAVVLRPGATMGVEELREFCGPRLARYKLPRFVHVMAELPLNGAGKILKTEIRKIVAKKLELS
ncbi:acyl-CoA synthetase [Bradyrhizobium liaoningense]